MTSKSTDWLPNFPKPLGDILHDYSLQPNQVPIVGSNHDSEIAAGVRLGIRTAQTLRPGVPRSPAATYHIQGLRELGPLLDSAPGSATP